MIKVSKEVELLAKIEYYKQKDLKGGGLTIKEAQELKNIFFEYTKLVNSKEG